MTLTSVTLDEVFAAAHIRAASLVPEISGYLTLAVADASARLPFRLEDPMVMLTTEGTVKVARGTAVVSAEDAAAIVRDLLARLLACSIGSMPGLAAAARPRSESAEGVDSVIRELEAALVPVNRAAARRALARLARETARAKESGKLRRRRKTSRPAPGPAVAPAPIVPTAPAVPRFAVERREPALAAPAPVEPAEAVDVEFSPPPAPAEPTPTTIGMALVEELAPLDPLPIEAPAASRPRARSTAASGRANIAGPERSEVEDLLARFVVSTLASPDGMRQARASLKRLAELDPTPPPPAAEEIRRITDSIVAARARRERPLSPAPVVEVVTAPAAPLFGIGTRAALLITLALIVAGLLGHYVPILLAEISANGHALTSAPEE